MQMKNNYDMPWEKPGTKEEGQGVYNGDMGVIERIRTTSVDVLFDDDRRVEYPNAMLEELELAYAVTVHKSQGSEFPAVVIPVFHGTAICCTRLSHARRTSLCWSGRRARWKKWWIITLRPGAIPACAGC